ncbi:MAG: hypothetical protein K6F17_03005 [Lachnospiraceae bacterium]|nr:hypothetical protein [Lachnospiraceae bacterium]
MKKFIDKYILNSDFWRVVVSFFLFLIVTGEAICGFWLNSFYKDDCIFGENTYYACPLWYKFITYAEVKSLIPNADFSQLDRMSVYDENIKEHVYTGPEDDVEEIVYSDSDEFECSDVLQYYVENVLLDKYKDHIAASWGSSVFPEGSLSSVNCDFVTGPETIVKTGRMCVESDECVSSQCNSVGDNVYIAGEPAVVTGLIKEFSFNPSGNAAPALISYIGYRTLYNGPRLYRSYDQLGDDRTINGREYSLHLYNIKFDHSVFSSEDLNILEHLGHVDTVKSSWNRYATGYIYIVPVFAFILFIWFLYRVKVYVKGLR